MDEPRIESGVAAGGDAVAFLLRFGRLMHALGTPAHRVEEALADAAARLGLVAQFFATPTSLFAAFGAQDRQRTHLVRVEPGEVDLGRLEDVHALATRVIAGEVQPRAGLAELERIERLPPRWDALATLLAFGIAGGAAARFLGGGEREMLTAAGMAMGTGGLAVARVLPERARRMFEPIAAFLVSAAVCAIGTRFAMSTYVATLGGLIVLLPGLTLTAALAELNTQHLVSGTARLTGALVRLLGLGFGVALGARVAHLAFGSPLRAELASPPAWTEWAALSTAPIAFTVLLRAAPAEALPILGVSLLAFAGGRFGAQSLGPELGVFAGACAAALASNLLSRRTGRPAILTLTPALLLLVPGSVGFRSVAFLLEREVLSGIEAAFRMLLMFAAIVAGVQVAGVIAPPAALHVPRASRRP